MGWITLKKGDEEAVLSYVKAEPEVNLFISGDLLSFGLDGKHVRIHAYQKEGVLAGILLRYMDRNYVFYTQEKDFPYSEMAAIIKEENPTLQGVSVSGKSELVQPLAPYLAPLKVEETMMARCNALMTKLPHPAGAEVRFLTSKKEMEEVYALESTIAEFAPEKRKASEVIDGLLAGVKRGSFVIGVYVDGVLVSSASSTADSALSSMLVGVMTRAGYRQKGYASLAVGALLEKLFARKEKFVCLFYDNPLAGRIYHAFGFSDVAPYTMLH
jgi:predicted GNAT family acetyltransferase